jgi:isoleucyl-tRNA synthetase
MVEQRADWVNSRHRAWGVPIALFVEKKTGELLVDADVNMRITLAVSESGVDAWTSQNAAHFLGPDRNPDDYEMVGDILDVWFDSGCTHVFVLESGHWPEERWPADLYLEGSDQHRGWFQSSLLESCGTRGRAPYNAVLTHGFTMDAKGMKMSKSLGNTVNPIDLMKEYGADILRLWALSVDFTEDHRIGREILAGVADQYRKLRNTFRYLLGALEGFERDSPSAGTVPVEQMPELERYMLYLTAELEAKLKRIADFNPDEHWSEDHPELFDFTSYVRLIADFANNDLSAFYFDIRKDVLYCEVNPETGFQTERRRAYRTVLDTLFHALVRWLAPVLVFTTEEVWATRFPEAGSVHLLEWPELPLTRHPREGAGPAALMNAGEDHRDSGFRANDGKWDDVRAIRQMVTEAIEPLRKEKVIGSSLEADVKVGVADRAVRDALADVDMAGICIVSRFEWAEGQVLDGQVRVTRTNDHKCGRCWRHLPEVSSDGELCARCEDVLNG